MTAGLLSAQSAYCAAAADPHPAFGEEKVYIFGAGCFIDDLDVSCPATTSSTSGRRRRVAPTRPQIENPSRRLPGGPCSVRTTGGIGGGQND